MLINLSNHPSSSWSQEQYQEGVKQFGRVIDLSFPVVSPEAETMVVEELAEKYLRDILAVVFSTEQELETSDRASGISGVGLPDLSEPSGVHLMGELTFCFALAARLQAHSLRCVVSTTERKAIELDGMKLSQFNFVKFRDYPTLLNLD